MTINSYVSAMKAKHRKLDLEVLVEEGGRFPDRIKIRKLKVQKLMIKDRLSKL